jgi:predicted RecA/RadA family phage recombinase
MAETYFNDGMAVTVPAPANVNSGQFVVVGNIRGIAQASAASAASVAIVTRGEALLPKPNAVSTSMAVGANVHWDATNSVITASATSNAKVGVVTAAVTNTAVTARVFFFPQ